MQMIRSREDLESIVAGLPDQAAADILNRSKPALAFKRTEEKTASWLSGNALLQTSAEWPSVDGRALVHTARFELKGLPTVVEGLPGDGFLSIFDGYPWIGELEWDTVAARHLCRVVHDDGNDLVERTCPLDADELENYWPSEPRYVVPEGPYWTIPNFWEVGDLLRQAGAERSIYDAFYDAIEEIKVEGMIAAQLFGVPDSMQNDEMPRPRNDRADRDFIDDGWMHLATVKDSAGVFDYYFAVTLADFRSLKFAAVNFDAQC